MKKAIRVPFEEQACLQNSAIKFLYKCQNNLLQHLTNLPEIEALSWKGFVHENRGEIHTAIFYYKKACKVVNDEDASRIKESLVDLLVKAFKTEYNAYADGLRRGCINEAKAILKDIQDSEKKFQLQFYITEIEISQKSEPHKPLHDLKKKWIEYEKFALKKNKDLLNKKELDISKNENEEKIILEIISESKRVLDQAINYIKSKKYANSKDCYYPTPNKLQDVGMKSGKTNIEDQMEVLFEKYGFKKFRVDYRSLFKFLVGKQPNATGTTYNWLQKVFDIRNAKEHDPPKALRILQTEFPTNNERERLVTDVGSYAMEVYVRIYQEITPNE